MDTAVSMVSKEKENDVVEIAERLANERIIDILFPENKKNSWEDLKKIRDKIKDLKLKI